MVLPAFCRVKCDQAGMERDRSGEVENIVPFDIWKLKWNFWSNETRPEFPMATTLILSISLKKDHPFKISLFVWNTEPTENPRDGHLPDLVRHCQQISKLPIVRNKDRFPSLKGRSPTLRQLHWFNILFLHENLFYATKDMQKYRISTESLSSVFREGIIELFYILEAR